MDKGFAVICVVVLYSVCGHVQSQTSSDTIQCRVCNLADTLSDCNKLAICDSTLEECYMDELITDQLVLKYNGGCRSKAVKCALEVKGRRLFPVQEAGETILTCECLSCCSYADDCNKRLCAIKDDTLTSSACYSCGKSLSHPCTTLEHCQQNEMCLATQSDIGGVASFYQGCLGRLQCSYLMNKAYQDYSMCVKNTTSIPNGLTWAEVCGGRTRSTSLCHSCCGDPGCNYGACHELNERIFNLADNGKFNFTTLKTI